VSQGTESFVYVVGPPPPAQGPVKIGTSNNVARRLRELRAGDPMMTCPETLDLESLEVLYAVQGNRHLERALHLRFASLRVCGEWFNLDSAVAAREVRMAITEIPHWSHVVRDQARAELQVAKVRRSQYVAGHKGSQSRARVERRPTEQVLDRPSRAVTEAARQHEMFRAWLAAGFSEDQALRMVVLVATQS
jgi:hypothetical protein